MPSMNATKYQMSESIESATLTFEWYHSMNIIQSEIEGEILKYN